MTFDRALIERLIVEFSNPFMRHRFERDEEVLAALRGALEEIDRTKAPPATTARALELAAEIERHDEAMTHLEGDGRAPWRVVEATGRRFDHGLRHYVTCIPVDQACWSGDDMVAWSRLGIWTSDGVTEPAFATGIAYLRNAAPEVAAVLRGLAAEVEAMQAVVEAAERHRDKAAYDIDGIWPAVDALRAKRGTK